MEHPDGGDGNSSSANDHAALPASSLPVAALPSHQSAAQPQGETPFPSPSSDFLDSSDYSGFTLHLGCDSSDMEEEEEGEEELRDIGENQEEGLPSPIPKLKFSSKFTLTPSTSRQENEESEQPCSLATPSQAPSLAVNCPERPSKLQHTSTSRCESSLSCRLLFSAVDPASPVPSTEENSTDDNLADLPDSASTRQCLPPLGQAETAAPLSPRGRQVLGPRGCMEDQITPIHSPSSSCSECTECSSSPSSSPAIPCTYPLASLVLSPARLSSPGREEPEHPSTKVVESPPARDPQGTSDTPEKFMANSRPHSPPKSPENAMEEGQATMDPPLHAVEEGVSSAARKANDDSMVSLAPSSTGSVRSNWTVISGISPLPSSDPSHPYRRHHHHHGHHHHHHGHHHHHHHHHGHHLHHRKHRDEDQGQGTDNMLTSTPINKKHVVKAVDVSAVASSQDAISDPRFILTSELLFSDLQDNEREEAPDEGKQDGYSIRGSSESDKENIDPGCAATSVPAAPHVHLAPMNEDSTTLKRPRHDISEDQVFELSYGENDQVEVNAAGNSMKTRKKVTLEDLMRVPKWKKNTKQIQPSSCPQRRPLSKKELEGLLAARVNFSLDYFESQPPSPHLSSTMDELLFRDFHRQPRLYNTLD